MMKYRNVLYTTLISALCLGTTSCSDFLDEMPDNRTELTTEESITKVLVSAYPMTTKLPHRRIFTVTISMKIAEHTATFSD